MMGRVRIEFHRRLLLDSLAPRWQAGEAGELK
jgi:hypothetical protein